MTNRAFNELTFTVFDTETTGFSRKDAKIVEIAAVKILPGFQIDFSNPYEELINPEIKIPYGAYKVHKISNEMVCDKPSIKDILPSFLSFAENTVLAGHNISRFDMAFLERDAKKHNIDMRFPFIIDTCVLTKKLFPRLAGHNLDNLIKEFNVNMDELPGHRHRALFDAANTAVILIKCMEELRKNGICRICDL